MQLYTIGLTNRFKNWVCVRQRSVPWLASQILIFYVCSFCFFPFHCCFAGSLQFSLSTVKYTKLFHSNFLDVSRFCSRKTLGIHVIDKVECLWSPTDFFLYVFVRFCRLDLAQRSIASRSFWPYWPIKTSHCFIQSQFLNKKQRVVHGQEASNINCSSVVLIFDVSGFYNQSPLLCLWRKSFLVEYL